jgi:predicted nucleotidyltransferase
VKNLTEIKKILVQNEKEIKIQFKVKDFGIFGSMIRAESKPTSDIDILVDFKDEADLIDLTGLALFLEEKLKQKADIVPKRALREEIREEVLSEVVNL